MTDSGAEKGLVNVNIASINDVDQWWRVHFGSAYMVGALLFVQSVGKLVCDTSYTPC